MNDRHRFVIVLAFACFAMLALGWRDTGISKAEQYDLQERCAKHAQDYFSQSFATFPSADYVDHYSASSNKCIMKITTLSNDDDNEWLFDLNGHQQFAHYIGPFGKGEKPPLLCYLKDEHCKNLEEWKELVRPYVEE